MPRTSKTKYTILGLLANRPMSGYDIKSTIQKTISHFWNESEGQIYPSLFQLLKEQSVTCNEKLIGKRLSKIYTITEKGLIKLKNWLKQDFSKPIVRDEFLLKLFFGKNISPKDSIKHIIKRKNDVNQTLDLIKAMRQQIQEKTKSPNFPYWIMMLENAELKAKSELKWCDKTIKKLKTL